MDDFKVMARLLAAIRKGEEEGFEPALVSERALRATEATRDRLALRLQREGYVEGLFVLDDVDNAPATILWNASRPSVTIKGLEFIASNSTLRKAMGEIKSLAEGVAARAIDGAVGSMM